MNSRAKGCRGERQFRDVLRAAGYCNARRGQQFSGGNESPDVVCPELPTLHFEVKNCQAGNPYKWLEQAKRDAGMFSISNAEGLESKTPIVAHKRNGKEWLAVLRMEDLLEIIRRSDLPK